MKKIISTILVTCLLTACFLTSCGNYPQDVGNGQRGEPQNNEYNQNSSNPEITTEVIDPGKLDIPTNLTEDANSLVITCSKGSSNCWSIDNHILTFSNISADTVYSISGEFEGQIVIDGGDDYKFELELCGAKIYSSKKSPITILSGKDVTITAKKETQNFIYDTREVVDENDETSYSAAIWANCDLKFAGKGELTIISSNNNGIHTKDDLQVKNLTLSVTCVDNALKGNDSVEITGGILTLVSKSGDGIKTVNTDISSKGNQRGIVSISAGTVTIYAACDGIDASYDVDISNEAIVKIYTDCYSPYSEGVESSEGENQRYIRFTSNSYKYSVKYYNSDSDFQWANATYSKSVSGGRTTYYYYSFEKVDNYKSVQIFIYSNDQEQGQEDNYIAKSDYMSWNTAYDTFAMEQRGTTLSYNWTNYTTVVNDMGRPGGMGGMMGGNSNKSEYSTKGIKAGNEIIISGGTLEIYSYDDAIHANNDASLENGNIATGNVTIIGGNLTIFSKDDGIHADGTLLITGGKINVTGSYEGLEGTVIKITDGDISVISSDDGINSTASSGTGIIIEGGKIYVYAGGDGIDANSRTQYQGIIFSGGSVTVISTSNSNSSIDTEQGYTYKGGSVLAICPSNGMGSESTKCQNFTSIASKTTMNLSSGQTLNVIANNENVANVMMPCNISALIIYLGSNSAKFST